MSALTTTLTPEVLDLAHNRYHAQAVRAANEGALWAALTGIELLAIKEGTAHGDWLPWVEAHCAFSPRTATRYMDAGKTALKALASAVQQPSLVGPSAFEEGRQRLAELLENDGLAEDRAGLLAAIKPPKPKPTPAQLEPPKPAKPRKPPVPVTERPLFTPKAVPMVVERWKKTPVDVRHAFLDSIRDEAIAYFGAAA